MGSKLYVGNLSWSVDNAELTELFSQYGTVSSAEVVNDFNTGRSKGFGFVQMSTDEEAKAAAQGLDGQAFQGRPLKVNEARPKEDRPRGGGFGGGGGGRSGGGGGYGGSGGGGGGYGGGGGGGGYGGGGGGYGGGGGGGNRGGGRGGNRRERY